MRADQSRQFRKTGEQLAPLSLTKEVQVKSLALISILALTANANAMAISNNMTCSEAKAYYQEHGRIYTQTGTGDIVPIYGDPECRMGEEKHPVFVRTQDTSMCKVAFRCFQDSRN